MILGVLQARMGSSRLPGKVLKKILNRPMLALQIERIKQAHLINKLIIATSNNPEDDAIESLCADLGVECFRGSLNHVLERFYQAAVPHQPGHVVRLTGDCPLIDPEIIDQVIQFHLDHSYDYSSNTLEPSFPDGLDLEVMKFSALKAAFENAELPSELEHVTPYIHRRPDVFSLGNFKAQKDVSFHRWTVDEPEDFELVAWIFENLNLKYGMKFRAQDVLGLLGQHPEKFNLNQKYVRNEGMKKSLLADQAFVGV